ncbi:MAG: hypothetical protein ABI885_27305 [Gammaproteobacteria bacterium]
MRALFSVNNTDGGEPALCLTCLRLAITDALVTLCPQRFELA